MSLIFGVLSLVVAEIIGDLIFSITAFPRGLNSAIFAVILGLIYYLGVKVLQKKIEQEEKNFNIANFSRKRLLLVSLALSILVVFMRDFFRVNKEIYEASLLINYTANTLVSFAAISYARAKGRNEYWGVLGIIGLAIAFFLKSKPVVETQSIKIQSGRMLDIPVVILLVVALFWGGVYMANSNLKDEFIRLLWVNQLFLVSTLVVFVTTIWLLIKNKRFILTFAVWLSLVATLISLFLYNGLYDVRNYYVGARNWFFMCLTFYLFFHLVVHGFVRLSKHNRNIFTPEGLVNYSALLIITTFVWGIYDWLLRVI